MEFESIKDFYDIEKKSDASQKIQKQFQVMLMAELKNEEFNNEMVNNVLSCVGLGSGYTVFNWLNEMGEEQLTGNLNALTANLVFKKNDQRNSLKLLCSMLSRNFVGECNSIIVEQIIRIIQSYAKNKTGNYVGNLENIFLKYFVDGMGLHVSPFEWEKVNCNQSVKESFCKFLRIALSNEKQAKRSEEQIRRIEIINKWIDCAIGEKEGQAQSNNNQEMKVNDSFDNKMSNQLNEIANYIKLLEKENKSKSIEIEQLTKKLETEKQNSGRLLVEKNETEKTLSEKKQFAAQLSQSIEDLKEDIDKRDTVLTVFQADKKESEVEKQNALAAELKVYYSDFQEAKDMEMDIEIGNFLSDTLGAVFDVLKKNGIDVTV